MLHAGGSPFACDPSPAPVHSHPHRPLASTPQDPAERRFEARLAETGARDPREFYREVLRSLRDTDPDAYREMVERYQSEVVEVLAHTDQDPLLTWLEFGRALADRAAPGTLMLVDGTGRATPAPEVISHGDLLLQVPEDRRTRALPVAIPPEPTPAQRATLDLLVKGRVRLTESD
jgi:hypothetical protein